MLIQIKMSNFFVYNSTKGSDIWRPRHICKVIKYSSAQMRRFAIAGSPYLYGMETQ